MDSRAFPFQFFCLVGLDEMRLKKEKKRDALGTSGGACARPAVRAPCPEERLAAVPDECCATDGTGGSHEHTHRALSLLLVLS